MKKGKSQIGAKVQQKTKVITNLLKIYGGYSGDKRYIFKYSYVSVSKYGYPTYKEPTQF